MEFVPPLTGHAGASEAATGSDSPPPSRPEIDEGLERILASRGFLASPRLQALLRYVTAATLDGQSDRLKEFAIGVDVFDRPPSFDPRVDSIVRVQASRLRKQIALYYERAGSAEHVRIDVPAGGYQATFARIAPSALPAPAADLTKQAIFVAGEADEPAIVLERTRPPPADERRRPRTMFAALAVASFVLLSLVMASLMSPHRRDAAIATPSGPAIFVSRFQLVDGPGYGRQLRDGLQFELIDRLHQFPELSILGVDTVYGADADAASRDPKGADFILGGSVQSSETNLRVTTNLVRTTDNTVVWSQVFESPLTDAENVLKLQSEIAGSVAGQLGQPYGVIQEKLQHELSAARRMSLEDYLCVLDSYAYSREKSEASHLRVRACLEDVTARSPNYAPAWAKLSWMYGDEERFAFNRRVNATSPFERARSAAHRAVEVDPDAAMGHQYLAIALFNLGDDAGFRAESERALQLNPNNSEILADVGQSLILLDGSLRGREMVEKAIALNPGHPPWYYGGLAAYAIMHREKVPALSYSQKFAADASPVSSYMLAAAWRLNGYDARADETLATLGRRTPAALSERESMVKSLRLPPAIAKLIAG